MRRRTGSARAARISALVSTEVESTSVEATWRVFTLHGWEARGQRPGLQGPSTLPTLEATHQDCLMRRGEVFQAVIDGDGGIGNMSRRESIDMMRGKNE